MTEFRGDVLTKAEMVARGIRLMPSDRGGVEFRTVESLHTLAMELLSRQYIEPFHITDASILMDLRRGYHASQGNKWGMKEIQGGMQASERYDAIRHQIGIKRAARVLQEIEEAMTEAYRKEPHTKLNAYKEAFEELSHAMLHVKIQYA